MKKYVKDIDNETKKCTFVFDGTDIDWAISDGYEEEDVDLAYDGDWYLTGYAPVQPAPTEEELKEQVRSVRNSYLSYWDFTQLDDAPFTEDEKAKYMEYRQYLRDYTEQENWWLQDPDDWETWLLAHYPVTNS